MMKKYVKFFSVFIGIIFLVFLIANFGLNLWLKYKLPDFIKNNSEYKISYQSLDVQLATGNIFATGVAIDNKNANNQDILRIRGTVDTISIARVGIYDAVFNKKINTSDLLLKKPTLNIILAKPVNHKKGKEKNPIVLDNVEISDGNIQIFKYNKQKVLSVNDFNLKVENLQFTEESVQKKLPIIFDSYDINGKNLFLRPDNLYAVTATDIATKEGQLKLKKFALVPLVSQKNFIKFFPNKTNLFSFKASEMEFKDIVLKNNKVTLTNAIFDFPELVIYTTNAKKPAKGKGFTNDINLDEILLNNLNLHVLKPNGNPLLSVQNLNLFVKKFLMNNETSKGNIPFQYEDFKITGNQIQYVSANQDMKISSLSVNPKSIDLHNLSIKPTVSQSNKTLIDLTGKNINLKINEWKVVDKKLKLDIQNVLVNEINGKIIAGNNPKKKKPNFDNVIFPLKMKNVELRNSNIIFEKNGNPLAFNDLNAKFQNVEMNEKTAKESIPFQIGSYSLTTRNFDYQTKFYNLSAALLKFNKNSVDISDFVVKPRVSRSQYIKMIPTEKDLYDIKVKQISMKGTWDLVSNAQFLEASQVTLDGVNANVFRSKIPKDDLTEKPMYSKLLRSIKFPMFIQNLDIKNSFLEYEEDTKKSDGPGKLTFNNFNMNVKNLNSGKMKGKPTLVPIAINCRFMNASPMNVKWSFDTANSNDAFSISGNIADLPASRINPFIEPYLKVRATGLISDLIFNFKGNYNGLNGSLNMKHQALKISVLKESGEKDKLLSAVANVFVRSNSGVYPESVVVDNIPRDKTKSFFNLFWKGIEEGLKKTLIGKNIENTEKSVKKTVETTKSAIEKNKIQLQETKEEVKTKVQDAKQNIKEKGGLRNIFKKKTEK